MPSDKLWAGRFATGPDPDFERFSRSLPADLHLFRHDIRGSLAHVAALRRAGLLSEEDAHALQQALEDLLAKGPAALPWRETDEDIHSAIERILVERLGQVGLRLHAGRSRNDQVATDAHLYAREAAAHLRRRCLGLARAMLAQAEAVKDAVVTGMTHLQPAQPVLLAHHLLAYGWMAVRDARRFAWAEESASAYCPLGAGALAGSGLPLDLAATAQDLGFREPYPNSIDAVSDRDFLAELTFACALTMVHLSRLAEEVVLWSTAEFRRIRLSEGFSTGSSMMPQKRNPDSAELVRGKTGGVLGDLMALLVTLKALPLAYMRDLQEDKPPVYHAVAVTDDALAIMTKAISEATFPAAEPPWGDLSVATDLAEWLVEQGMPFREAHHIVARLARLAEERGGGFETIRPEEFRQASALFPEDLSRLLDPRHAVARRTTLSGTAPTMVERQKAHLRAAIEALATASSDEGS